MTGFPPPPHYTGPLEPRHQAFRVRLYLRRKCRIFLEVKERFVGHVVPPPRGRAAFGGQPESPVSVLREPAQSSSVYKSPFFRAGLPPDLLGGLFRQILAGLRNLLDLTAFRKPPSDFPLSVPFFWAPFHVNPHYVPLSAGPFPPHPNYGYATGRRTNCSVPVFKRRADGGRLGFL